MSHPHVIRMLGYWNDPAQTSRYGLVMEYMVRGNLRDMIINGTFGNNWDTHLQRFVQKLLRTEKSTSNKRLATHVGLALVHLKEQNVVHCDIKLTNVLVCCIDEPQQSFAVLFSLLLLGNFSRRRNNVQTGRLRNSETAEESNIPHSIKDQWHTYCP
jgi:serine/threonine protein kinase